MYSDHRNNFDFLRIAFAMIVIISHANALSGLGLDCLLSFFSRHIFFMGVYGFFVISGFLVTGSMERSPNAGVFVQKRIFRIFPGLIAVSIFSAFVLGPFLTMFSIPDYFRQVGTYQYLFSTIFLLPTHKCLPGVFEHSAFSCDVNGSLWTIRYELLFYAVLTLLFFAKKEFRQQIIVILLLFLLLCFYLWKFFLLKNFSVGANYHLTRLFYLSLCFFVGAFMHYNKRWLTKYPKKILFLSIPVLLSCLLFDTNRLFFPLVFPVCVISAGLSFSPSLQIPDRLGDISYGVYIYGFPLQQMIHQICSISNIYFYIFLSLILSGVMGFLSWHLIEKKCLYRSVMVNKKIKGINL